MTMVSVAESKNACRIPTGHSVPLVGFRSSSVPPRPDHFYVEMSGRFNGTGPGALVQKLGSVSGLKSGCDRCELEKARSNASRTAYVDEHLRLGRTDCRSWSGMQFPAQPCIGRWWWDGTGHARRPGFTEFMPMGTRTAFWPWPRSGTMAICTSLGTS